MNQRKGNYNGRATRERILDYVRSYTRTHHFAPSQREIAQTLFYAESTVRYHLRLMQVAGLLTFEPGKVRTIRLTEAA